MLTRGTSVFTPVFLSSLAPVFFRYIDLKRSLGRRFDVPARTLQSLDRFLQEHSAQYPDLNAAAFEAWCHTHEHVSSGVRRVRMLEVAAFCLYRRRTEPQCFAPDPSSFPAYHQRVKPYIFSEAEVTELLRAASGLPRNPTSPLRPEVIRLAIVLLFTTGIRRGELLALNLGDYDARESTLHIRETKFYKSRMLPLNDSIAEEMDQCLRARARRKLPASPDTALIWNAAWGGGAYSGTCLRHAIQPLLRKCGIVTAKGKLPRIHDFRHAFAVNALLRWYRAGADVEAKLPLLATYLGHGSAISTHYYLHFIEPLWRTGLPIVERSKEAWMKTAVPNLLGAAIRDYFTDHLPRLRGTSPHTILSYRDSMVLLLRFLARQRDKPITGLDLTDLDPPGILAFLAHLEQERNNGASTRNVRLSAIHAFFHFVAARNPEHLALAQRVLGIPFKRTRQRAIDYLEYEEIDAILKAIDRATPQGSRDYAMLATMFNTGGRVQEIADLRACDLQLTKPFQVRLFGKGRKERYCPLWPQTAAVLRAFCHQRNLDLRSDSRVFLNHRGQPLTRFGIRHILRRCLGLACERAPNLRKKRLHPHSVRHSTAVALLKSGVDLSTISHLLGHASPTTTNRYAKVDLEMKRQAIAKVKPVPRRSRTPWSKDRTILDWLESL